MAPSFVSISRRYANASPSQLRQKQEIDTLLKKYSKIRIPKESQENQVKNHNRRKQEEKDLFLIANSNQLQEQQQLLNYQREQVICF